MRATRNWGTIRTGETFEALATTLIFFEDPGARLFGRRGRDGGQDARSGDGKTVYQAKHHESPTAAKAIADAKKEAAKIAEYRKGAHTRHAQWADVSNWVLLTNASFNPTDEQAWQNDVVPLFKTLGLTATYWEQAKLDGYLAKHPEVDRAFFENEIRVFLSPAEACVRVADDDPFTQRDELAAYVGREADLEKFHSFLGRDKRYLLVHAAGGIGKTRFLLEAGDAIAGEGEWQVLWANVRSMEASTAWFDAVVPERPTLLLVDEPQDERLVQIFWEQLAPRVGRAQQWKIVIAVRSSNDPILQALRHPRMRRWVDEFLLEPLTITECEEMCRKLLDVGKLARSPEAWRRETAETLARRFDGFPIWLSLAVHLLEEEGSLAKLPDTAGDLCRLYLNEVLGGDRADEQFLQLARWVALLGPINREDESEVAHLVERTNHENSQGLRENLQMLTAAKLLRKWGARDRLVDVKPDVLRDFILRDWFCEERDYGDRRFVPSEAAARLSAELGRALIEGEASKREERVLAALARVDFLQRHGSDPAGLGESLFAMLNSALPKMTASQRISLIENLKRVGPYYPEEILQLLRRLRQEGAGQETVEQYWSSRTYSQSDVILALAHPHQYVAYGILTDGQSALLFEELYALVLEERRISPALKYGLPNDGKRAEGVIRNLLESGPAYPREFGEVAAELVLRELSDAPGTGLQTAKLTALQAIVKPLCDVQRHQTWSEGMTIQMQMQFLPEGHANRRGGAKVQSRLRSILEQEVAALDDQALVKLWDMVSEAHRQANYGKGFLVDEGNPDVSELNKRLLEDLQWLKKVFAQRTLRPHELRAARKIWHWHAEHEADEALGNLARELEEIYFLHPTVQLFENLTHWERREDTERVIESKALELATSGTEAIQHFVAAAIEYLGPEDVRLVHSVAAALGKIAGAHESVRSFLTEGFRSLGHGAAPYLFAMSGISAWVFTQRRESQAQAAKLVSGLLDLATPKKRIDLLRILYGSQYRPTDALVSSASEIDLIRGQRPLFEEASAVQDYLACTLWGLNHRWEEWKEDFAELLQGAGRGARAAVTRQLVEGLYRVVDPADAGKAPPDLLQWFWNQLAETADLGSIDYEQRWYVNELVKTLGKAPLPWLVNAVRIRAALQLVSTQGSFDPPSKLVPFVNLVGPDNVHEPEVQGAVSELVGLFGESAIFDHWLPKLLARVDPQGLEVPRRVAALIDAEVEPGKVQKLVRTACYYKAGTPSWRHIARPAFKTAQTMSKDERMHVYSSSSETGHRSYTAAIGTVAQTFIEAVDAAKRGQAEEVEHDFVPFWEWRLQRAEYELRHQQEQLKEEVWG